MLARYMLLSRVLPSVRPSVCLSVCLYTQVNYYHVLAYGWQTIPKRGVVRATWPIFNFDAHSHISGTAEVRDAKFCVQVEYIKC